MGAPASAVRRALHEARRLSGAAAIGVGVARREEGDEQEARLVTG